MWSKWDPCVSIMIVISDKTCSQMIFRIHKKVFMFILSFTCVLSSKTYQIVPKSIMTLWCSKSTYYSYDQNWIHMCQLWLSYEIKHIPRWYLEYMGIFLWLFYHYLCFIIKIMFRLWSNRSWRSKPTYCSCDQNGIHMCQLWIPYVIKHVPRWYLG